MRNVKTVMPLVAHPGHMFGRMVNRQKSTPHGFQERTKPTMAVSPVASVYRSISMLRKYCTVTLSAAAQRNQGPMTDVMNGQMMYSPDPTPRPARMTLGPRILRSGSGSGMSRYGMG